MLGLSVSLPLPRGRATTPPPADFLRHPTQWRPLPPPVSRAAGATEARLLDEILRAKAVRTVLQPIVSLRDGAVFGYEALSRGPAGGPLEKPDALIAAALRHGRMLELEHLFRHSALRAARRLPAGLRLFLNVNPNIIQDARFREGFTREYLTRFALCAEDIVFEITERESVANLQGFLGIIEHYKAQNYQISIDDAGAGYSGLNLISDVQPHFIKLDMQLVRGVDKDLVRQALIRSMQEFAGLTNTRLIAEGIETEAELATLVGFDVPYGQGFFLRRPHADPLPPEQDALRVIQRENKIKNRFFGARVHKFHVKNLCRPGVALPPSTPIADLAEMFDNDAALHGLCVVSGGVPLGTVTRHRLHRQLSGRFGFSLFAGKTADVVMDKDFLHVEHQTTIDRVARLAMTRDDERLYDLVVVTREGRYLGVVTVKELLEKSIELEVANARQLNPLSELPGNALIDIELERLVRLGLPACVLYFDIDSFKAYNDKYGFNNGDKVLKRLSASIREIAPEQSFVGHIGGDDFIAVSPCQQAARIAKDCIAAFDQAVPAFYSPEDAARGYLDGKNRAGAEERFPLMSLSIVGVNAARHQSVAELARAAAALKKQCKALPGSNCRIAL